MPNPYQGLDPDTYRSELIGMGASNEDAEDAAADLSRRAATGETP